MKLSTLVSALIIAAATAASAQDREPPDCTTDRAIEQLKRIMNESPSGKAGGLVVFSIEQPRLVRTMSADERQFPGMVTVGGPRKSVCEAIAMTNAGRRLITFTTRWDGTRVWMEGHYCRTDDRNCSNRWKAGP